MSNNYAERLEEALFADRLIDFVVDLKSEGLSKEEIYEIFSDEFVRLQDEERYHDEDKVTDVMDLIWGYCHSSVSLFMPDRYSVRPGYIKFFAGPKDQRVVLDFILGKTPLRVFQSINYETSALEWLSVQEVDTLSSYHLCLWSDDIASTYIIHQPGLQYDLHYYSFHSNPEVKLNFGDFKEKTLTPSSVFLTHDNRYLRGGPTEAAFQSIEPLRELIDHCKVATANGISVMKEAYELTQQDYRLKEGVETRWEYPLDGELP